MGTLQDVCSKASVTLRTYTAQQNDLAKLATTTVASSAKNAVDVRVAFDIGRSSLTAAPGSRFLVVTKDLFGKALADVKGASTDHATLESRLPRHWRNLLGVPSLSRLVGGAMRARAAEEHLSRLGQPTSEANVSSCGTHCHVCGITVERERDMRQHLAGKRHQRALLRRPRTGAPCKLLHA